MLRPVPRAVLRVAEAVFHITILLLPESDTYMSVPHGFTAIPFCCEIPVIDVSRVTNCVAALNFAAPDESTKYMFPSASAVRWRKRGDAVTGHEEGRRDCTHLKRPEESLYH